MPAIRDVEQTAVKKSSIWFDTVSEELGNADRYASYMALRSALHVIRDRLPREEAVVLGEQLPLLVRGIFYEGWCDNDPTGGDCLSQDLQLEPCFSLDGKRYDSNQVMQAVCRAISAWVSDHSAMQIRDILPHKFMPLLDNG